ncbi:MAG: hypothetical protein U0Y82_13720 [Thermoleophilia bacterium]
MRDLPVIDEPPRGMVPRLALWLRQRRLFLAACLALLEVAYIIFGHPGTLMMTVFALLLLVVAVLGMQRVPAGIPRDALMIVAIAQGLVVAVPLVIGLGVALGIVAGLALLVLLAVAAFRLRV